MPSARPPWRTLLVADHDVLADVLVRALTGDARFDPVASVQDSSTAPAAARRHRPDIVVFETARPTPPVLAAAADVRSAAPEACLVLLSTDEPCAGVPGMEVVDVVVTKDTADIVDTLAGRVSACSGPAPA